MNLEQIEKQKKARKTAIKIALIAILILVLFFLLLIYLIDKNKAVPRAINKSLKQAERQYEFSPCYTRA